MTTEKYLNGNWENENNPETLKQVIKFWQEKALRAEMELLIINGNISLDELESIGLDFQKIRNILDKKNSK
ncbi:hypothetical protein JRG66_11830 [Salinimicrobium tongyeongense]|uniref:Uncharacterized protein n=1 Tax=Salinimicrobium tongyeongense TaxID=2809707 RepID=A0ABY6NP30_9FLAO|nr:hypothetical protein [Salinimicrobium tongyeongense]UZH54655.1 hypothetical protein JRG66_11830 [Salinimicrobium tongyeongense]